MQIYHFHTNFSYKEENYVLMSENSFFGWFFQANIFSFYVCTKFAKSGDRFLIDLTYTYTLQWLLATREKESTHFLQVNLQISVIFVITCIQQSYFFFQKNTLNLDHYSTPYGATCSYNPVFDILIVITQKVLIGYKKVFINFWNGYPHF